MLIAFTIYVAYLIGRSYTTASPDRTRRFAAVLGIVAFVNVPMVYYSVNLWSAEQQLHPTGVVLAPAMVHTRYTAFAAIIALFCYLVKRRYELEKLARQIERLDADLSVE